MSADLQRIQSLLSHMANGEFHSGEYLGRCLGVSRAAVWKRLQEFTALGIEIECVRGKGYRLPGGCELISDAAIRAGLDSYLLQKLDLLKIEGIIDSTNKWLLRVLSQDQALALRGACIAEMQTAGQGRRGRIWQSPFGSNIYMSVVWPFVGGVTALSGLSLAVGVALVESLNALGVSGCQLKWPNDVLYKGKKIAGVLIEIAGDVSGECHAIVGVGLNVSMPVSAMTEVGQPWADIASICSSPPARNVLASSLLNHLIALLDTYESQGFVSYLYRWQNLNAHQGKRVVLSSGSVSTEGCVLGVSDIGALRLRLASGEERDFVGGEISLRDVS